MEELKYLEFFKNITKDTPIKEYEEVFAKDARFKDPFHDVVGVEAIYEVFAQMYQKLDDPKFEIIESIQKRDIVYIKWNFMFKFKNKANQESFEGVSRVELDRDQRAISHVDYWDSGENLYEKIPVVSSFIRFLKRQITG